LATFTGTAGADTITPSFVSAGVTPFGVFPDSNADTLFGGKGNDTLSAGNGDGDVSYGGNGNDYIYATLGIDSAYGGVGIDTLDTTLYTGDYTVNLTTGLTDLAGESYVGFENLISGSGNDLLTGTAGANLITSGAGNDTINYSGGDDTVYGGAGNDYVHGSNGVNVADGGDDIDTIDFTILAGDFVINLATGITNFDGESILNFENILSGEGNDFIVGTSGSNAIYGGMGNDTVFQSGGNDTIYGGDGDDVILIPTGFGLLDGGDGIDTLDLTALTDHATIDLAAGLIQGFFPIPNFENLLSGRGNDSIIGTEGNNRLEGAEGDDTLAYSGGDDTLLGGEGNDLIIAPGGLMTVDGGIGNDTLDVRGYAFDYAIDLATGLTTFLGESVLGIETLLMGAGNDTLTAAATGSTIDGGTGNDMILGGRKGDVLIGGLGADTLTGERGRDVFVLAAGDSVTDAPDSIVGFDNAGAAKGDRIDLRLIDANDSRDGNQAFVFGGTGKGQLRVVDSGGFSVVQGNTDKDAAFEFVLFIEDGGVLASAYTAADFML
jgi:Ca2+-binding RTX toxin-like protein